MAPSKEFERNNARQWDTESNFSVESTAHPHVSSINQQNGVDRGRGGPHRGGPNASASTFQVSTTRNTILTAGASLPHQQNGVSRGQSLLTASTSTFKLSTTRNTQLPAQVTPPHKQQGLGRGQGLQKNRPPTFVAAAKGTPSQAQVTPPHQQGQNGGQLSGFLTPRTPAQVNGTSNSNFSSQSQPPRSGLGYNPGNERRPQAASPLVKVVVKRTGWAAPPRLVTTRMGIFNSEEELKKAEMQNLRSRPDTNEEFPVTGYYLWPKGYGDPMSMLDSTLKTFDLLRSTYTVHIDWNDKIHCLRINGKGRGAEKNVAATIEGIKLLYLDAKAQAILASPLYIIVPPTADAMRSIVRPKTTLERPNTVNPVITSIELAGGRLSAEEKVEWESIRRQMVEENNKVFRAHVIKRTLKLADLRGWMRMRIQFGHINLGQYQKNFSLAKYSFDMFIDMMQKSRVTTGGTFDRKMDASIAMDLVQKIVARDRDFCPKKSNLISLGDVQYHPKHTEIIFITSASGQSLRIETDIEVVYMHEADGVTVTRMYQLGTTRLFENSHRNKRVEVTTFDIERKLDWTLEVITVGEIKEVPGALQSYIAPSLSVGSTERTDSLGLPYPGIVLRIPVGFVVQNVVLRSVFQYTWINTDNVVEIAIYREWDGWNTRPEPGVQASVSMFNSAWDTEMESIENTTLERKWDRQLHNIFGKDGVCHNTGLKGLIAEVVEIQRLLSKAAAKVPKTSEAATISADLDAASALEDLLI